MKQDWHICGVLPNLRISEPIENELLVLVSVNDDRVRLLEKNFPLVKKYLSRFTDQFNQKIDPAIILFKDNEETDGIDADVVVNFRNCIAVSCLLNAYRDAIKNGQALHPVYSGVFSLYPIIPSRGYTDLSDRSIGKIGLDDRINLFHGQTDPNVSRGVFPVSPDKLLLSELLKVFSEHHNAGKQHENLFRSLQVAFSAMSEFSPNFMSVYDYGMKIIQWISAFEILLHDGTHINRWAVEEAFNLSWWDTNKLPLDFERKRKNSNSNLKTKINLAGLMCEFLYDSRDAFIHGNDINNHNRLPFENGVSVYMYAPILYNCLLCKALGLVDNYKELSGQFSVEDISTWEYLKSSYKRRLEESLINCSVKCQP